MEDAPKGRMFCYVVMIVKILNYHARYVSQLLLTSDDCFALPKPCA